MNSNPLKASADNLRTALEGRNLLHTALLYLFALVIIVPLGIAFPKIISQQIVQYLMPSLVLLLIFTEYTYSTLLLRKQRIQEDDGRRQGKLSKEASASILSSGGRIALDGALGRLARLMFLDVFGTSLLNGQVIVEIKLTAFLLANSFVFHVVSWTCVWNLIFYSGKSKFGFWTVLAVICGAVFASVNFLYERQLLTADTSLPWHKKILAPAIRLAVLLLSAFVISQPVMLMLFSGSIQARIHEESVIADATNRLQTFEPRKSTSGEGLPISDTDHERLSNWITKIRDAKPGAVVEDGAGWTFKDQEYDLFQQVRILDDLLEGRQPRWPAIEVKYKEYLNAKYNLSGVADLEQPNLFRHAYWLMLATLISFQLFPFALRVLASKSYKAYYSSVRQKEAGSMRDLLLGNEHETGHSQTSPA